MLGLLVEKLSGLTPEAYFQRHIFEPLGLKETFCQVPTNIWRRVTRLHRRRPDGVVEPGSPAPASPPRVSFFAGDGGLLSAAPDYLRLVQALLQGGEWGGARILQAASVEPMSRNQIGGLRAGEIRSFASEASFDVH